jgi:hypothetical protein
MPQVDGVQISDVGLWIFTCLQSRLQQTFNHLDDHFMAKYCITAVNHINPDNHCASEFKLWKWLVVQKIWTPLGAKPINFISDLLAGGHTVLSGRENGKTITTGCPIEIELRIAKNGSIFNLSEMSRF